MRAVSHVDGRGGDVFAGAAAEVRGPLRFLSAEGSDRISL